MIRLLESLTLLLLGNCFQTELCEFAKLIKLKRKFFVFAFTFNLIFMSDYVT